MDTPKILIASPTYDGMSYCIDQFLKSINNLTYKNFDFIMVDNSKENNFFNFLKEKNITVIKDIISLTETKTTQKVVNSRNLIREYAIKNNYKFLLTIDTDVIVPPDTIQRLLKHKKEITSGIYYKSIEHNGFTQHIPFILTACDKDGNRIKSNKPDCLVRYFYDNEIKDKGLIEIEALGLGITLISQEVLTKIHFRYEPDKNATEDMYFAIDAKKIGYKIYADTDLKCKHLLEGKTILKWK